MGTWLRLGKSNSLLPFCALNLLGEIDTFSNLPYSFLLLWRQLSFSIFMKVFWGGGLGLLTQMSHHLKTWVCWSLEQPCEVGRFTTISEKKELRTKVVQMTSQQPHTQYVAEQKIQYYMLYLPQTECKGGVHVGSLAYSKLDQLGSQKQWIWAGMSSKWRVCAGIRGNPQVWGAVRKICRKVSCWPTSNPLGPAH